MPRRERRKGLDGEAEVRRIFQAAGLDVRDLERAGDHAITGGQLTQHLARLHGEVKRCETARPWAWMAQAEREAPAGTIPVVTFRRSRSPWYTIISTDALARLLS